jgi:hypothetical protein
MSRRWTIASLTSRCRIRSSRISGEPRTSAALPHLEQRLRYPVRTRACAGANRGDVRYLQRFRPDRSHASRRQDVHAGGRRPRGRSRCAARHRTLARSFRWGFFGAGPRGSAQRHTGRHYWRSAGRSGLPSSAQVWLPLTHMPGRGRDGRGVTNLRVFGRLQDGAAAKDGRGEIETIIERGSSAASTSAHRRARVVSFSRRFLGRTTSLPGWHSCRLPFSSCW